MQDMMATCRDMVCVDNDVDITPVDDSPNLYVHFKFQEGLFEGTKAALSNIIISDSFKKLHYKGAIE